ncbi:BlaI/MecI/CopY family transcriptional regulator [Brumicola pallidula]|uniref:Transcriptional regulator, TrmB n=1 Tax=Brumicola pallidula DSM 14239 = ACAM 615 TaxID=1121922 RepID=K6YBK1_9ALTE|nr:BlaI/MecI/CopY family transcriptional regulator [Glaciecola pallidula]GAC30124.1 transcriptional regulator, TrmB [Glaciecola pallidula DSM 14239 = ACAM 615]
MFLGELEKQVLQYLWSSPNVDAKQVHAALAKQRDSSPNTVQSALERLFKKGLLSREKQGHAYLYRAKIKREELIAKLIDSVASDFISQGENSLVAAFSSVSSDMDEGQLDQLEKLIEIQRSQLKQSKSNADK